MSLPPPQLPAASARVRDIVAVARTLLAEHGWEAVSMRAIAEQLGIRAPSLYKHITSKEELRVALIEQALVEMGTALHDAGAAGPSPEGVTAVLAAYRANATAHPELYRLATTGVFPGERITPGLEDWSGHPFWAVTGEPHRAQALWACAHGLAVLEIGGRVTAGSLEHFGETWAAAARAFGRP